MRFWQKIDDLYRKYAEIKDFEEAPVLHRQSVHNWVDKHKPLFREEEEFLSNIDDFMTTRKVVRSGGRVLEKFLSKRPDSFLNVRPYLIGPAPRYSLADNL